MTLDLKLVLRHSLFYNHLMSFLFKIKLTIIKEKSLEETVNYLKSQYVFIFFLHSPYFHIMKNRGLLCNLVRFLSETYTGKVGTCEVREIWIRPPFVTLPTRGPHDRNV